MGHHQQYWLTNWVTVYCTVASTGINQQQQCIQRSNNQLWCNHWHQSINNQSTNNQTTRGCLWVTTGLPGWVNWSVWFDWCTMVIKSGLPVPNQLGLFHWVNWVWPGHHCGPSCLGLPGSPLGGLGLCLGSPIGSLPGSGTTNGPGLGHWLNGSLGHHCLAHQLGQLLACQLGLAWFIVVCSLINWPTTNLSTNWPNWHCLCGLSTNTVWPAWVWPGSACGSGSPVLGLAWPGSIACNGPGSAWAWPGLGGLAHHHSTAQPGSNGPGPVGSPPLAHESTLAWVWLTWVCSHCGLALLAWVN